jgi:hypothetical protein
MSSKLREVLQDSTELLRNIALIIGDDMASIISKQIVKNTSLLAEPLRNCDVGTPQEQSVRMAEFCREQYKKTDGVSICSACRFHNMEGLDCQFAWAQLPYEYAEGDAE